MLLTDAWRTAERERDAAEQRFTQVRELSNFLLFDLYDQLEDVPGTTRSLNEIADRARIYLDTLARSEGTSPELRLEAALAYKRLADVLGTPLAANLGRREEAGEALELSVSQLRALHREHPDNPDIAKGLGEALYSKAVFAFIALDDNEAAHDAASEAATIYRRFASGAREQEFALAAIDAEVEAALPLAWMGRETDAVAALKRALATLEAHLDEFGRDAKGLGLLARTESALAETITRMADAGEGDYEEGLGYADRAIATYDRLAEVSDKPDAVRRSQAISLFKRSLALYSMERDKPALADLDRADAIIGELRKKDAGDKGLVGTHAAILEQKAITLAYLGRHSRAGETAKRSTEAKRARLRAEPGNPGLIRDLASNLAIVAEVAELGQRKREACALYRESERRMREFQRASEAVGSTTEPMIEALPESIARVC